MLNWWLIVLAVILGLLMLGVSLYILLYYGSPEDEGVAYIAKGIVVLGMCLACGVVILLPYDVANRVDPSATEKFQVLDTETMWEIVLWAAAGFTIVLIPFTNFYYEAYDPEEERPGKQVSQALIYTLGICFAFALLTGVLWATVGIAVIDYWSYACLPQFLSPISPSLVYFDVKSKEQLEINVSIFVYAVAMLCAAGWVLFFFYGGTGLVSLPVDAVRDFMNRPKAVNGQTFHREMEIIAAKAQVLLKLSAELTEAARKRSMAGSTKNKINTLRNETYLLEAQQDRLIWAYQEAGGSPFIVYGSLFLGFVGAAISAMWIVHIFIYNMLNGNAFLNIMLMELDKTFSLLGVLAYAIFAFYLLLATLKGQIKIGMRLLFFQIHPMKPNDTTINSLLFNVGLVLVSSVAVVQFCAMSFREYASNTAINTLLNVYVIRLKGVGPIISYLQYVFVGVSILSLIWVILCPQKKRREDLLKVPKEED